MIYACQKRLIMGIDMSLTSTGLCASRVKGGFEIDSFDLYLFGSKADDETGQRRDRYAIIADNIYNAWREHTEELLDCAPFYTPLHVTLCFEMYSMGGIGRGFTLAELQGFVKGCLLTRYATDTDFPQIDDLKILEVPPTALKKWATGNGQATKDAMRNAAKQRFGQYIKDDNKCDAYLLSQMAHEFHTCDRDSKLYRDLTRVMKVF